jgi:hypothetical protein
MSTRSTSIAALLNQVRNHEIVLPDLQRDFVWDDRQIRLLLDSVMRGYPFGSLLLWNTQFVEVPFREFVWDWKPGATFVTKVKEPGRPLRMVLDGQQRLQSLYLAVHGSFDGKRLHFNVTSGVGTAGEDEEDGGRGYRFEFWRDDEPNRPKRLVKVDRAAAWAAQREDLEIERVITEAALEGNDARLAARNMRLLRSMLTQSDLVPVVTIDEEVMEAAQAKTIDEVLEIFVRVNDGGTRLTKSDLMFSLLKSKWTGARAEFDALLAGLNPARALPIDKDFVIRGLLTVADKPPSFDVSNVRQHWDVIREHFGTFSEAIKSALDFCRARDGGAIESASLLEPIATLHPIVYYLSRRRSHAVPDGERSALRTLLYFLLFNRFLGGRSPEARLRWIREVLQQRPQDETVPLDEILAVIASRQKHHAIRTSPELLNMNVPLALNIIQPGACRDTLSWQERAEVDHIFPQASFRPSHGDLVDDIGNFEFLGKLRNIRKSDEPPWEYFRPVPDDRLREEYFIPDRALLAPDRFDAFVAARRDLIMAEVATYLGR